MKKSDALPGKYLAQGDFDPPVTAQIDQLVLEDIKDMQTGLTKNKPVIYLRSPHGELDISRGIVIGPTTWDSIAEITGKEDADDWTGAWVKVYRDANVTFGGKKVGGIRFSGPDEGSVFD